MVDLKNGFIIAPKDNAAAVGKGISEEVAAYAVKKVERRIILKGAKRAARSARSKLTG